MVLEAAAKNLPLLKLRRLNSIMLACLCLLSVGTVTLSTYFILKLRSLRRRLAELEARVDEIDESLGAVESPRTSILSLIESSSSSSDLYLDAQSNSSATRKVKKTKTKKGILKKSVSFGSDLDTTTTTSTTTNSSRFETPPSSPTSPSLDTNFLQLDDNKTLELIQHEDYNSLKERVNQKQVIYENDSNLNNLIEYIKTLHSLSEKESSPSLRRDLEFQVYELAKTSVELYPDSYLSHKWVAITMSKIFEYISLNEKARLAFEMKKQLDLAIDINSNDYLLFYLRGRWYFKIYNMSWPEKYAVRFVFGNIPDDCLDAAFKDFSQAELLNKNKSKGNALYLAKCHIERKETEKAVEYLRIAQRLPTKNKEVNILVS